VESLQENQEGKEEVKSSELADLVERTLRNEIHGYSDNPWIGIAPQELDSVIAICREGIMGPGREQYERDGKQKFEDMPLQELVVYIKEEARDLINYGIFLLIRLGRIEEATLVMEEKMNDH
jgi:hypothetical protein